MSVLNLNCLNGWTNWLRKPLNDGDMMRYGNRLPLCLIFLCLSLNLSAVEDSGSVYEDYTFTTWLGPQNSPGWFDGQGEKARFNQPVGLTHDSLGHLYVADASNHTIRKIDNEGRVFTLAGKAGENGSQNGTGAEALFFNPSDVAVDLEGNVYVADAGNHLIRKISPQRVVTTVAGSPGQVGSVDGPGLTARFDIPFALAIGADLHLYVADANNHLIRKISPNGEVSTLAGTSDQPGSTDGMGASARFNGPTGLHINSSGELFVADSLNGIIRKITSDGHVTTIAGIAGTPGFMDGNSTMAMFNSPYDVTSDTEGTLYVADTFNHVIRKITADGIVSTVLGTPEIPGFGNGSNLEAKLNTPAGISIHPNGSISVAEFGNHVIRILQPDNAVRVLAGRPGGGGYVNETGNDALFSSVSGVAMDPSGGIVIADLGNHVIRRASSSGVVTTVAGTEGMTGTSNGLGQTARFNSPTDVTVDSTGNIFVADTYNHAIRKISPNGLVSTLAGVPGVPGTVNGVGINSRFQFPLNLTVDRLGNVFVSDTWNHMIRKITPQGGVTTLAGRAGLRGSANGAGTAVQFNLPQGLALDSQGNLFVCDTGNSTIRKITPNGVVTTFAGEAGSTGSKDGIGVQARFFFPFGIAIDTNNNLYVTDEENHTIRKITSTGLVTTLGGSVDAFGGLDGTGSKAVFWSPEGITVAADGTLYIADASTHSIRLGRKPLSDAPIIDALSGPLGQPRSFDILNAQTAFWSWSIVRQPAGSNSELHEPTSLNPTMTPDINDVYVIRYEGYDDAGNAAIGLVEFQAIPPTAIQLQLNRISGSTLEIRGIDGTPNGSYTVYSSSEIHRPFTEWKRVTSGSFDESGGFSFLSIVLEPNRFYRVEQH